MAAIFKIGKLPYHSNNCLTDGHEIQDDDSYFLLTLWTASDVKISNF